MSYNYRILNDRPAHFFFLDGTYIDYVTAQNATVTGSPAPAPPLVVGGGNFFVFDGSNYFRFISDIFYQESVNKPFSFEAWFKPNNVTGPKTIIGHSGQDDGLSFDGEKISFSTFHEEAGSATASYYPSNTNISFHVIGVHTGSKNELYVNGTRVASVDLTEAQFVAPYEISTSSGSLYVGSRAGELIIDSIAVYSEALSSKQAKLHFLWGRDVPDFKDVVSSRGGTFWSFTDETSDVAYDFRFDQDYEWLSGQSSSVRVFSDQLLPEFNSSGITTAGTWMGGIILGAVLTTIGGSKIEWDGDGSFIVETSINNGSTWSPATSGRQVTGLTSGTVSGTKSLQVRIRFLAGEPTETISKVRSLSIKLYRNRSSRSNSSVRTATFTGSVSLSSNTYQPIEQADDAGLHLYGGYATIPGVEDTRTIESWVSLDATPATNGRLYDARAGSVDQLWWNGTTWVGDAGSTYYVNGVQTSPAAMSFIPGRKYHLVSVLPTVTTGSIFLGSDNAGANQVPARFGMFATYPNALTAAEVSDLYNAYLGISLLQVTETSALDVQDADDVTKLYSYDWSVTGSG